MEKTMMQVFDTGLTPGLAWTLLQMLIVLFVVLSVRNWMSNFVARRLAYRTLRSHQYLTEGCWVRLPTSTGSVDGRITRVTPQRVVLKTEETFEHIPIMQFVNGRKSVLVSTPSGIRQVTQ